ncbi:DUF6282 family protein [Streptomyces aurantiacus]|uniref:Cytosolic protein n=1 Tax=Streptomyces aurantiacus TaxID=47760 RepID=A0A7G1NUS9_9ACTN|nr:DUF6282 family protein [Streptomyces aurantiacus]BCL25450.1 hypothetical protein GCM10017557_03090 [Streptomyces aurantiacus]
MPTAEDTRPVPPAVLSALTGAVDLHCHSGPSPFPRRLNHVEAAHDGARIGMRAILVKSHHHNTVMDLLAMETWLADAPTPVYGGVALNTEVGGVNPSAVAMSLRMGGRCVWAPTTCARQHIDHHSHAAAGGFPSAAIDLLEKEVSIFDASGEVSADTAAVVDLVAETGTLLTGGHLDTESMKALFSVAESKGVRRLLVQHPDFIVGASESDIEELLGFGAYIEHEIAMYHPEVTAVGWPVQRLVDWIDRVGPERTVISSDLGQKGNPLPVDGYIYLVGALLDHGVAEKDIRTMVAANPAFLLGLEDSPS